MTMLQAAVRDICWVRQATNIDSTTNEQLLDVLNRASNADADPARAKALVIMIHSEKFYLRI
jgi:hypothetical protein